MADMYRYVPHPRIAEHRAAVPTKVVDQRRLDHPNPVVRFNARFGLHITVVVGTMWCAYLFTLIAFYALPTALRAGTSATVLWTSSEFLQLVLLPIIIVGQNIQARASDKRAEDTYKDAEAVLHEATQIQEHLLAQDEVIGDIIARLQKMTNP
ncbi:MAG TPA: hypothetical protein VMQ40_05830 [Acidimicrobiales bacterium]|jgi:hypothetical protein|nr:hypothetical protein [Acidimicrobiales bacterium]